MWIWEKAQLKVSMPMHVRDLKTELWIGIEVSSNIIRTIQRFSELTDRQQFRWEFKNIKNSRQIKTFPNTNEPDRLAIVSLVWHGSVVRVKYEMLTEICSEVPRVEHQGESMKNFGQVSLEHFGLFWSREWPPLADESTVKYIDQLQD